MYKCMRCNNVMNKPLEIMEEYVWIKDGKEITYHCRYCGCQELDEISRVWAFEDKIFTDKDDLLAYMEEKGFTEEEIEQLMKTDVLETGEVIEW